MLWVLEAQLLRHLADALSVVQEAVLHLIKHAEVDHFLRRLARLLLQQITKVVGREAQLAGEILHRGQAVFCSKMVVEVMIEQRLKLGQQVVIDYLAGDELALVEAQQLVKEDLDV